MTCDELMQASKGLPANAVCRVLNRHTRGANWHGFTSKRDAFHMLLASDRHGCRLADLAEGFAAERRRLATAKVEASRELERREEARQRRIRGYWAKGRELREQGLEIRKACDGTEHYTNDTVLRAARERADQLIAEAEAYAKRAQGPGRSRR